MKKLEETKKLVIFVSSCVGGCILKRATCAGAPWKRKANTKKVTDAELQIGDDAESCS
jgi:hypothetical protein